MHWIDYMLVAGYLLLILVLGLQAGRKVNNMSQFATAGGGYGAFVVFATLSASYIGGGFTMGNAGVVYGIGIANIVAIWGFSIKEILVGYFLAPRLVHFPDALSAGDITGKAYGKGAKVLTGGFGVLVCIGIVGAQVGAMGTVFTVLLGMNFYLGVAIGCTILIVYSTFGGIRAVVVTDLVQFGFLAIGLPLVLVFGVIMLQAGGETTASLPEGHLDIFSFYSPLALGSLFLVLMFGEALVPPYLQRLLIGKPRAVGRGTVWSGIFSIPFFLITGSIGLIAVLLEPNLSSSNHAIPYVIGAVLPLGIKGLVVAGIISVSMSSADSFLNSAAVCFTHDVVNPLRRKPLSDRKELMLARIVTATGGLIAVVVALTVEGLLTILLYAYNLWAPVILVPLVLAFFQFRATSQAVIIAAIAGISGNMLWSWAGLLPTVDGLLVGILVNGVVFLCLCQRPARK